MKEDNEIPYIDKKEILSAELRRLSKERKESKVKSHAKRFKKSEKEEIFHKTNGLCHICGVKLACDNFSITSPLLGEADTQNSLPACKSCKRIHDNYLPDEIRWTLKIGLWAKTQIEFETEIGKEISAEIIEQEKHRENSRKRPRIPLNIDIKAYPVKINHMVGSKKTEYHTIKEVLFWSYANLGMAFKAVNDESETYGRLHYIIRKKLFNGLMAGSMNVRSMFHDEKSKLHSDKCCVYCGKTRNLQIDHIIPQSKGGSDSGENLVLACKKCNTSKHDTDLMEWYHSKNDFPPLHLLRNYLKLVIQYCNDNGLMDSAIDTSYELNLPFAIEYIPLDFPKPDKLFRRFEIGKTHDK